MDSRSPGMRELARRLLDLEAASSADGAKGALRNDGVQVCDKLRRALTRFAGADGFAALLRRSITLAGREVPAVSAISIGPDCSLEGLDALPGDAAAEVAIAITSHILGLLASFIGAALTLKLVRDAWPDADLDLQHFESRPA